MCEPQTIAGGARVDAPVSINVQDVHIRYRVYEDQAFSARQWVSSGFKGRQTIEVHAVQGVSFEVRAGEVLVSIDEGVLDRQWSRPPTARQLTANAEVKPMSNAPAVAR